MALGPHDAPTTILVVDDEPDILATLARTLEAYLEDVQVLTAPSGPEALEILSKSRVDLILTDYRMPAMTGLEFLGEARKVAPTVPRVMITAYPDMHLAIQALNEERILNFLTKPVQSENLIQVVSTILSDRRTQADGARSIARALGRMEQDKAGGPEAQDPKV